jgi:Protein of unknown function (DUF1190)
LKRSEVIVLGAIGLLMTAALWPSNQQKLPPEDPALATGDGFQTLAFASLDECKASQAVTSAVCDTEYAKASQATVEDAPKFEAVKDCEAEYGASQCRPATWNGASVFIPAMAGVLIARSLASAAQTRSQPLYPPRIGPASCPPGISLTERPECAPRSSTSSGGGGSSSGGSSSSRSYYSTGTGRTIGRTASSFVADAVLSARTPVSRTTVSRSTSFSGSSSSSTSISRPSSSTSSPSPTVSRSGFGSTSRSFSTSS